MFNKQKCLWGFAAVGAVALIYGCGSSSDNDGAGTKGNASYLSQCAVEGKAYFTGRYNGDNDVGLLSTDGTEEGTEIVKLSTDFSNELETITCIEKTLYISVADAGYLYKTETEELVNFGTSDGDYNLVGIPVVRDSHQQFYKVDGKVYFVGDTVIGGFSVRGVPTSTSIWSVNEEGTLNHEYEIPATVESFDLTWVSQFMPFDGKLYIRSYVPLEADSFGDQRVFVYDGTTLSLVDGDLSQFGQISLVGNDLYTIAKDIDETVNLYKMVSGTTEFVKVNQEAFTDQLRKRSTVYKLGDSLFVQHQNNGVYKIDSNNVITNLNLNLELGIWESFLLNEKIYLGYEADGIGTELGVFDGTSVTSIKDIETGVNSSWPSYFLSLGDKLLFSAGTPIHGTELHVTDGTAEGTKMVKDINTDGSSGAPDYYRWYD